jgi:hypothetical protein
VLTRLFFPALGGVRLARVWWADTRLHLEATTTGRRARCPECRRRSRWIRSHYQRTLADLPCGGAPVAIHLRVRRFACRVPWCRRRIFTEQVPALAGRYARRTLRLRSQLTDLGLALGGEAGARQAGRATPTSASTLLRLVRAAPLPPVGAVRALGVDDFALRRGQR